MGRLLRRVPMDFKHPMGKTWPGYVNPFFGKKCTKCDGLGNSPEFVELHRSWYDFEGVGNRWCDDITQDELDALIEAGRIEPGTPLKEVNDAQKIPNIFSHDAINRWICIEARAKRLGYTEKACKFCDDGMVFESEEQKIACDNWKRTDPPKGDGFQLWENTSDGSPMSPVYATLEELCECLAESGASAFGGHTLTAEEWCQAIGDGDTYNPTFTIRKQ